MKPGQKLVCISREIWYVGFGPAFNEVVTFKCFDLDNRYIHLNEYTRKKASYQSKYFAPLSDITEIQEILSAETITEKV